MKKSYEQKSRDYYNNLARGYENSSEAPYTMKVKERFLAEIVFDPENNNVLDVACGNGTLLNMISSKHSISGYGVDIS